MIKTRTVVPDIPGGKVVKNSTANEADMGSPQLLSQSSRACKPQPVTPCAATTPRPIVCALQKKPAQWEAPALQLEKIHVQQRRPRATKTIINKTFFKERRATASEALMGPGMGPGGVLRRARGVGLDVRSQDGGSGRSLLEALVPAAALGRARLQTCRGAQTAAASRSTKNQEICHLFMGPRQDWRQTSHADLWDWFE